MFTVDERIVALGIIGPITQENLEECVDLAVNHGMGELHDSWSLEHNTTETFALSYKHASNKGIRMSKSRVRGVVQCICEEMYTVSRVFLWVDRIARRRLGKQSVNWGSMGLAPYSQFRTIFAPQWEKCPIQEAHNRMWLRMEAVLSACCRGYFVFPDENQHSDLLASFRHVLGPSWNARYVGMRYVPELVLKELAISVVRGNWDVTVTSFEQDKVDAREWALQTVRGIERDLGFQNMTTERVVMRQLFSNYLRVTSPRWKRPSEIGVLTAGRGSGAHLRHPPVDYGTHPPLYSVVVGKTVVVVTNSCSVFAAVDDCAWSLPVGHCGILEHLEVSQSRVTGHASEVRTLRAFDEMTGVIKTVLEAEHGSTEEARRLAKYILNMEKNRLAVKDVIIKSTEDVEFSWVSTRTESQNRQMRRK